MLSQEKILQEELSQFDHFIFPENGLQKLEHLKELQLSIERNQAVLKKKSKAYRLNWSGLKPDFKLIYGTGNQQSI